MQWNAVSEGTVMLKFTFVQIRGSKGSPPDLSVTNFRCHEWPGGSN